MHKKGTLVINETSCRSCLSTDDMNYTNEMTLTRIPSSQKPDVASKLSGTFQRNKSDLSVTIVEFEELQTKLQMKQAYVQYVSHEIRTPLQVISAGLSLLRDDLKGKIDCAQSTQPLPVPWQRGDNSTRTDCETETSTNISIASYTETQSFRLSLTCGGLRQDLELIEIMHDSTLTAVNILNDLLLYEKVESDMLVIEQSRVHLFAIIMPVVKMLMIQSSYAGVSLTWDLGSLMAVYALLDASKFGQVMRNLISNAIKFTPKGGTVHISAIKIAELVQPDLRLLFNKSACMSHPKAVVSRASSSLPFEANHMSFNSLSGLLLQPSPPTNEMPSPITKRPSLSFFSRRSSFANVDENISSLPVTTAADRFSASFQIGEGVDIQEQPVEPPKPTLFRISVRDSGCGISQVWWLSLYT